jgi:hypothetical protein
MSTRLVPSLVSLPRGNTEDRAEGGGRSAAATAAEDNPVSASRRERAVRERKIPGTRQGRTISWSRNGIFHRRICDSYHEILTRIPGPVTVPADGGLASTAAAGETHAERIESDVLGERTLPAMPTGASTPCAPGELPPVRAALAGPVSSSPGPGEARLRPDQRRARLPGGEAAQAILAPAGTWRRACCTSTWWWTPAGRRGHLHQHEPERGAGNRANELLGAPRGPAGVVHPSGT